MEKIMTGVKTWDSQYDPETKHQRLEKSRVLRMQSAKNKIEGLKHTDLFF
jgi:hypothetical protein